MTNSNTNTFLKITNQDIYTKLEKMDYKLGEIEKHVITTNGKVRLNTLRSKTALTLIISVIVVLLGLIVKSFI